MRGPHKSHKASHIMCYPKLPGAEQRRVLRSGELQKLQDEAESELTAARKAAQALIMAAKDATTAEQNKKLAEAKAVRNSPRPPTNQQHTHPRVPAALASPSVDTIIQCEGVPVSDRSHILKQAWPW